MTKLKDFLRYVLWIFGFRTILSSSTINKVVILENGESLITVSETEKLRFAPYNQTLTPLVREKVAQLLHNASLTLPQEYTLFLIEAYRSKEEQQRKWDKRQEDIRKEFPSATKAEILRLTTLGVAKPTGNGPHQTGGAVDVSLLYQGLEVDMGTAWIEFNSKTPTTCSGLSKKQEENRKLLLSVMRGVGFVNYPGEWWHFCYGDRMWAAYNRKSSCMYGPVEVKSA